MKKTGRLPFAIIVGVLFAAVSGGLFLQLRTSTEQANAEGSDIPATSPALPMREVRFGLQWEDLDFQTINQEDPSLERGQSQVRQVGKKGTRLAVYRYLFEGGKQSDKSLFFYYVTAKPLEQVVVLGVADPVPLAVQQHSFENNDDGQDAAAAAVAQREAERNAVNEQPTLVFTPLCKDGSYGPDCTGHGGVCNGSWGINTGCVGNGQ